MAEIVAIFLTLKNLFLTEYMQTAGYKSWSEVSDTAGVFYITQLHNYAQFDKAAKTETNKQY